ncbi:MAG: serine hydrolase [Prevotellaceae bacterium]|jgi:beta-glucosidase-like glycosyl hydrolase/CubicO group peptidase (beta-lactamase class C family)|nr:serine hydrolase [Prevotellaceae bacterium]
MMKIKIGWVFVLIFSVVAYELGLSAPEDVQVKYTRYIADPVSATEIRWVDSVMERLSPRERIAQLFMMQAYSNLGEKHERTIETHIRNHKIGGLVFFQGTPEKQIELTNRYQSLSKIPLLIGMDAEWGVSMRLDGVISFPRQMALGSIVDNRAIYELGAELARQCKLLGVHLNFAPVVDVNNNRNNPVINSRSFGENQYNVGNKGVALMKGMSDNGVIPCAKHFPGHGDTENDSHKVLPVLHHSRAHLDSIEMRPFRQLIDEGVPMVMVGHLHAVSLERGDVVRPASISEQVIKRVLRDELFFRGLVISDALNMNGVKNHAAGKNVALEALKAGHDILLMPADTESDMNAIERAVASGELSRDEIDEKCRKVLAAKYRAGLARYAPAKERGIRERLNSPEARALNNKLTEKSVILASNKSDLLPFRNAEARYGYLAVGGFAAGREFAERIESYVKLHAKREILQSGASASSPAGFARKSFDDCDAIIVGYHSASSSPKSKYGANQQVFDLLSDLAKEKKVILVCFGSPYMLSFAGDMPSSLAAVAVAHNNSDEAQDRVAQMLFGGIPFEGRMPVGVSNDFPEGSGITTSPAIRLKYMIPEEAGMSERSFAAVDSLVRAAIDRRAFPGCQVLAAHKGRVFYHKSFGKHTYDAWAPAVKLSDVYDIASVTKVSATLPLIMKMTDQKIIELHEPLGKYLTDMHPHTNKDNLIIRDILLHKSGLPSWKPFHYKYFVTPDGKPAISPRRTNAAQIRIPGTGSYLKNNYILDPHYFSTRKTDVFARTVAANIYGSDKLRRDVYDLTDTCSLMTASYRYSDLGFVYLQRLIESLYSMPLDNLARIMLYEPLGMYRTGFLPSERIPAAETVPTENDAIFRRQLLRGYVHDQIASLSGGVSGNAGLFSTANDMAKLAQTYLNGGEYGGLRFFLEQTVTDFTSCPACDDGNRRGLGFDKPETRPGKKNPTCDEASPQSYGHLGFTGTMIWIDPERDLVYVFLSNRINPSSDNNRLSSLGTRKEILAHFIKAIDRVNADAKANAKKQGN